MTLTLTSPITTFLLERLLILTAVVMRGEEELIIPCSFQAVIPESVCPSFRSFAISRNYRLKMSISVVVGGKDFEVEFEVPNVVILSSVAKPEK